MGEEGEKEKELECWVVWKRKRLGGVNRKWLQIFACACDLAT